jgi:diketogulonate reductase-like aldo/keto reductase
MFLFVSNWAMNNNINFKRRDFLAGISALALNSVLAPGLSVAAGSAPRRRAIPKSGELLPVIGMGTWITFNIGENPQDRAVRTQVLQAFFDNGGALIDSSPMYGSAEEVLGYCLPKVNNKQNLFAATKVWVYGQTLGIKQMQRRPGRLLVFCLQRYWPQ